MSLLDKPKELARRETIILKSQVGGTFGSKMTFTIGSSYLTFGAIGLLVGIFNIKKPKFTLPSTRVRISFYLNHMIQNSIRYANSAGAASFLYCLMAGIASFGFNEELSNLSPFQRNCLIGFLSGSLFKSTLGWRASLVGGVVGAGIIAGMNYVTDELRERDLIRFKMRFD